MFAITSPLGVQYPLEARMLSVPATRRRFLLLTQQEPLGLFTRHYCPLPSSDTRPGSDFFLPRSRVPFNHTLLRVSQLVWGVVVFFFFSATLIIHLLHLGQNLTLLWELQDIKPSRQSKVNAHVSASTLR